MMELHSNGKTIEDIEEVLHRIPLHPRVIPAIQAAHALGYVIVHLLQFIFVKYDLGRKFIVGFGFSGVI